MMIWVFNIMLYYYFQNDPVIYKEMVAQGAPCFVQIVNPGLPYPPQTNVQPVCFYDPSNKNNGHFDKVTNSREKR